MNRGKHDTSNALVKPKLRWNCDPKLADRICNSNRRSAEHSGYFEKTTFIADEQGNQVTFYDSNSGKPVFFAPKGRSWDDFLMESRQLGWLSFRDEEVFWDNVRCLTGGETISVDGTQLGHNIPDEKGSRYCINLVSVSGCKQGDNQDKCNT
mmetsp:Transcript_6156/g.8906  ORF Transcript_6156/g.8906 Transcript_6156/m.8906 type:complete len:152 (+) Transcript_6156:48-503(+)